MQRRFFWAMVAVAAVALMVSTLVGAVLAGRAVRTEALDSLGKEADAVGKLVATSIGDPTTLTPAVLATRLRTEKVRQTLALAAAIGGHDYVEVAYARPTGQIVTSAEGRLVDSLDLDRIDPTARQPLELEGEVDGEPVVAVARAVPLTDRGGSLVVVLASRTGLGAGPALVRAFLIALAVAVVLVALAAARVSRPLGARLRELAGAARRVAGGDLSTRVAEEGDDELSEVAHSFNDMAARLDDARRRERGFLMNVGHDLRTPLTTIGGYAETLADGSVEPDDVGRVGGVMKNQTERLQRLVEDLMLLSRLEAREFTLRPEPVDPGAHVAEVAEGLRGRAEDAGVRLLVEAGPTGLVEIDPDRVAQIVTNLGENALRYTPSGGRVSVRAGRRGGGVTIEVSDTGPGIDPADVPHIFERLYVARRYRASRPEGSGLGLSIVKELVDAMGGSVDVASSPGRGTTVAVWLPSDAGGPPAPGSPASSRPSSSS